MDSPRIFKIVTPQQKAHEKRNRWAKRLAVCLTILGSIAGSCFFFTCRGSKGTDVAHPKFWPAETDLAQNPNGPTLVLFVQPGVDHAGSQLNELYRRLCECKLSAVVVLKQDPEAEPLLNAAKKLPNTTVIPPEDKNAQQFQLDKSGQCLIYDQEGRLRFEGNLTTDINHRDRAELEYILAGFHRTSVQASQNNSASARAE